MNINLLSFIKRMIPSFRKSDAVTDLETSIESIETTVIPGYSMLEDVYKTGDMKSNESKKAIKLFYQNVINKESDFKLSSNKNIAVDILNAFKIIKLNGEFVSNELDRITSDVVISDVLSAYKAFLFRAVAHYSFLSKFAADLNNFFLISEVSYVTKDLEANYKLNKKQEETIFDNLWIFARLLSFYARSTTQFQDRIREIPDMLLPKDKMDELVDVYSAANIEPINNIPVGFVGSPIYSIRLVFAQWQSDRYKEFKDKKKLLELRYLHLKLLKEQGDSDVNLEKEIVALQRRITDLDYKIAKIEEDVNE